MLSESEWPYLSTEVKNEKSKGTFFSRTFKVRKNKVVIFFSFLAPGPRYCHFILESIFQTAMGQARNSTFFNLLSWRKLIFSTFSWANQMKCQTKTFQVTQFPIRKVDLAPMRLIQRLGLILGTKNSPTAPFQQTWLEGICRNSLWSTFATFWSLN